MFWRSHRWGELPNLANARELQVLTQTVVFCKVHGEIIFLQNVFFAVAFGHLWKTLSGAHQAASVPQLCGNSQKLLFFHWCGSHSSMSHLFRGPKWPRRYSDSLPNAVYNILWVFIGNTWVDVVVVSAPNTFEPYHLNQPSPSRNITQSCRMVPLCRYILISRL